MRSRALFAALVLAVSGAGCGSGVSRFPSAAAVSLNLKLASESAAQAMSARAAQVGSSSSSGLASLQVFVKTIAICLNLTVTQSQFSSGLNCATLYSGPSGLDQTDPSADQSSLAAAARSTSSGFTDLMSDDARSSLGQSAGQTPVGVGSYNWGYIQWAPPIKVMATIFDLSDNTAAFYTQDGMTAGTNGGSGYTYVTTASPGALSQGPAQTAVVIEPNAGSWFRLLSPFVVDQADVDAQNPFVVDLVFDPVGFVNGAASPISGAVLSDRANSIQVPAPQFLPIAHPPGTVVLKESYVAPTPSGTSDAFDVHVDLYYLQGDSAKTIQAAAIRAVANASSTTVVSGAIPGVAFLRQNGDGTTDFLDYANNPILSGLKRGQSGAATIACQGASPTTTFNPAGCASSVSATFAAPSTSSLN